MKKAKTKHYDIKTIRKMVNKKETEKVSKKKPSKAKTIKGLSETLDSCKKTELAIIHKYKNLEIQLDYATSFIEDYVKKANALLNVLNKGK